MHTVHFTISAPRVVRQAQGRAKTVVDLAGEVDLAATDRLLDVLLAAVAEADELIVLDIAQVSFLDCAAISCIVAAYRSASRSGITLRLDGARGLARRVLLQIGVLPLLTGDADLIA